MGKAPAFQFYVKDWLSDPQLRLASPSTRGIWIDLLCYMWEAPERGKLIISNEGLMKLTGANNGDIEQFFKEANQLSFCDICVTNNGMSQICNRRMYREAKSKEYNRLRQKKYREAHPSNGKVTPPSSTPTPSSTSSSTNTILNKLEELKEKFDWLDIDLWKEFRKYRTRIKAPLTARAELLCLADLEKLIQEGHDQEACINETLKSGKWKSFYPPKNKNRTESPEAYLERRRTERLNS